MPRFPGSSPSSQGLSDRIFGSLMSKARASGRRFYPLHIGDTYLDPIPLARAEAQRCEEHPRLHNYPAVQGEPRLLDAIVSKVKRRAGVELEREHLQVMPGATSGLSVVLQTVLDPGDEVLLLAPFWPLIRGLIASRGAVAVEVPFFDRLDWPDFDVEAALEHSITSRTAAIYLNTPHNPTGRVISSAALDAIARVVERHNLWVVCDEAYEDLYYGDAPPQPAWIRPGLVERAIVTHTVSKSYGLAGARVAFTHGPGPVMALVRGMQTFQTYGAARPMQFAAARALEQGESWLDDARAAYALAAKRAASALECPVPESGTFLFVDVRRWMRPGEEDAGLLERCLEAGVLLTPGTACGRDYSGFVRLCFTAIPPAELDAALALLRSALDG